MYRVVKSFVDLQDEHHRYAVGDVFPCSGYEPSEERLRELSTTENRRHKVMITEEAVKEEPPKVEAKKPEIAKEDKPEKPKRGRKKKSDA